MLACASVSDVGSVGLSDESPTAVDVKVLVERSTATEDEIELSDTGRSGVLKYAYSGTVNDSV